MIAFWIIVVLATLALIFIFSSLMKFVNPSKGLEIKKKGKGGFHQFMEESDNYFD